MKGNSFTDGSPIGWVAWDGASNTYGSGNACCKKCVKLTTGCTRGGRIKNATAYATVLDSMEPLDPESNLGSNNMDTGSELYSYFTSGLDQASICFKTEVVDPKYCKAH
jgi:hypothetical protein